MAQEYVPSRNDAMNEILDLQRDLRANNFTLCEEKTHLRLERFYWPVPVCQRLDSMMLGSSPPAYC